MNKLLSTVIGIGLAATVAAPSYAAPGYNHSRSGVEVHYADLNTASPAGAKTLLRRIHSAASKACGGQPYILDLRANRLYGKCVQNAMANAVASVNIPALTALHAKSGEAEVVARR